VSLEPGKSYHWRFIGDKAYIYGYCTRLDNGLYHMGLYNCDTVEGYIVDEQDIEYREKK
jgi:hypothetical protein